MSDGLLDCPFCGGGAVVTGDMSVHCSATCEACGATVWGHGVPETVEKWNRRAALPAVAAPGVRVVTQEDRDWIDARADELFRENERRRGGIRPATLTAQDYRDYFVVDATAERLAALDTPAPALMAELVEALDNLLEAISAETQHGDRSLTITGPTANLKWLIEAQDDARAILAKLDAKP